MTAGRHLPVPGLGSDPLLAHLGREETGVSIVPVFSAWVVLLLLRQLELRQLLLASASPRKYSVVSVLL